MEGESEITVKDWIEPLHWIIDYIENQKNHTEKFRIPILTLLILSLLTFVTSIINFQWIYVLLGLIGALFSTLMIVILNIWNKHCDEQSNESMKLLNDLLLYDDIKIDDIRIDFLDIYSKHNTLGEKSQKRLEELKGKKNQE